MNYKRTICIGIAFLWITAFWQVYDNIVPLILKNSFALEETASGIIMAADNVIAVVLLPVFGAWSDRANTRFGKRIPFIVVGTLLSVLFMMLVPAADNSRNFPVFAVSLGAVLLSMGFYRSPAVALMPDLTPPEYRSQGNAVICIMGALGSMYSLVMIQLLVPAETNPDYTVLFLSIAVLMIAGLILLLLKVNEKKLAAEVAAEFPEHAPEDDPQDSGPLPKDVRKSLIFALLAVFFYYMSYNGVTTAYSRYAQEVWGLTGGSFALSLMVIAVTAVVSYIPLGLLSAKFGRRKIIALGFAMMSVSFIALTMFTEYHAWLNLWFFFVGAGGSAVGVNIFPVVVDMCSSRDLGKYTGLYYTFSMAAQIVTPIASGFLLEHISYRTLFPYAALFALLGLLVLPSVRHGDRTAQKQQKLWEYLDS
ncbi:MAG: MFS transporter [Clostridia bacterium]|nr:MFS transporter [Clostridia bacterium]